MDGLERKESPPLMEFRSLKVLSLLGRGAKGIAFLVRNEELEQTLALKVISKTLIEKKRKKEKNNEKKKNSNTITTTNTDGSSAMKRIWFERDVLNLLEHPLLPKLRGVVVTDDIVSFAIDYCPGGNLNSVRKQQTEKMFSEDLIRFYAAEIVLALEYLHGLGIIYRDLKPENILIQENGHLMLVDFDLSTKVASSKQDQIIHPTPSSRKQSSDDEIKNKKKKNRFPSLCLRRSGISPVDSSESRSGAGGPESTTSVERSNSFVGTEEYVAPEIVAGTGHDFAVDRWGLGVVMYEMLYGRTPFRGTNRSETFYRILTKEPELVGDQTALRDLIRELLEKDPDKRISMEEIKGHDFFKGVDWDSVLRISRPPFIPPPQRWGDGEEDMEGIKGIDVEEYVKEVCESFEDGNKKETQQSNKNVWREGLGNPIKTSEFSVF